MQDQPNSWHLDPLECSVVQASAARVATPAWWHDSPKMAGQRGDVQCNRFASVPSSNKNVSWSGMIKVSSEAMASLYTNAQGGTTTEVKDPILQAIVAYDNISLMSAGHSMMTKRIKDSIGAEWAHGSTCSA